MYGPVWGPQYIYIWFFTIVAGCVCVCVFKMLNIFKVFGGCLIVKVFHDLYSVPIYRALYIEHLYI